MKRFLLVLLAFATCISIYACESNKSDGVNTSNNRIELTLDNYSKYLNISTSMHMGNEIEIWGVTYHDELMYKVQVKGASSNFNYNDVSIKVKVSGKIRCYYSLGGEYDTNIQDTFVIDDLNIAGDGSATRTYTPRDNGSYIYNILFNTNERTKLTIEVVSVEGYVVPIS